MPHFIFLKNKKNYLQVIKRGSKRKEREKGKGKFFVYLKECKDLKY
jgi:hypothetical protein